jgi:hypothetical protein
VSLFKSIFNRIARVSTLLILLGVISLNVGFWDVKAKSKSTEEDRRNARVQATYITRLVKFIHWEGNSTNEEESFKIVVLGNENLGFVRSLNFLVEQSNLSADGHPVEVVHFTNDKMKDALEFINTGVHFIYFTQDCKYTMEDVLPFRKGALYISEGRDFVVVDKGCIAFERTRNRLKLVVNETCFRRKFAKVNPVLTSLKSVIEVIIPKG